MRTVLALATFASLAACKREPDPARNPPPDPKSGVATKTKVTPLDDRAPDGRMYTTYFYTAGEAVIHGYQDQTRVRVVALGGNGQQKGTIWEGSVGRGETRTVPTGAGVFGFLSDKKAAILVGTPSSCAVVGYFLKDQDGNFRSQRFFAQLPARTYVGQERVIVWAYEPAEVTIRIPKTQKVLGQRALAAGERLELDAKTIGSLGDQVLEIVSAKSTVAVQVYYDQGFIVPSAEGRGAGTEFYVFGGTITSGPNDLDLMTIGAEANITVTDLATQKELFRGKLDRDAIKAIPLTDQYVRVRSDRAIQVAVAAWNINRSGYAEHHFATGREGGGIDNRFEVTTSGGLWLFSYFADNPVTVIDQAGKEIFKGTLGAGTGKELQPGGGLYRVKAGKGLSVMGGASACGADYSPAAGMFAVDQELMTVIQQVRQARIEEAKLRNEDLSEAAAAAPMTQAEWDRYGAKAKARGYNSMTVDEANQRADAIKQAK